MVFICVQPIHSVPDNLTLTPRIPIMRVIIDTNALRTEELSQWLSASANHRAVITDYAWMEIYKGNEKIAIIESLKVLRNFPDQVLLLKGTKTVSAIDSRSPGYANAMILSKSKAKFDDTIKGLSFVERSSPVTVNSIQQHGKVAKEHFAKMEGVAEDLSSYLSAVDTVLGRGAISEIRGKNTLSPDFTQNFLLAVDYMYDGFIKRHPKKPRRMHGVHRINHFAWRYALAANLLTKRYVQDGSNLPSDESKIVNEITDATFAVYGTYFNGVMSSDAKLNQLYIELELILRRLGARVPTHYIEHPDTIALFGLQTDESAA
jgi:hypothetical protein